MAEILNGGKATVLEPGFVARVGRKLRSTLDVWFGPDLPMPPSAPAGTPPRTLDYPVGYNINIQPRNLEPISFAQMRACLILLILCASALRPAKTRSAACLGLFD